MIALWVKKREKANINENIETLNFSVLCGKNCNFHHKYNFSSKTLILTKFFADSELIGLLCLCLAPKSEKKQILTKALRLVRKILDIYDKLQFPPQFQLFFQNTYFDRIFCIFRTGWTSIIAFCAKNREKLKVNENIETCTENFSVLYGKL